MVVAEMNMGTKNLDEQKRYFSMSQTKIIEIKQNKTYWWSRPEWLLSMSK